jgi:S1-C subfamily serine protease
MKFHAFLGFISDSVTACAPGFVALLAVAAVLAAMAPSAARAQAVQVPQPAADSGPLLPGAAAQGYLGVDVVDLDAEKAQTLKLKDLHGAVVTLIDHDAPAGQVGLKVNDVVLQIDGQAVDNADQLRKMLRDIPPGRKVNIVISRDGNVQTLAVELADRKVIEHDAWTRIDDGEDAAPPPEMGLLPSSGNAPASGGFHLPFFGSSLNIGAMVEPLTSQMAQYLGVHGGLIVKQVARKSEAATAGLRAFDVILKVGSDSISTLADWGRALRSNQGKPVEVTILRDKKQQTLTLQVDSRHRGAVGRGNSFPPGQNAQMPSLSFR